MKKRKAHPFRRVRKFLAKKERGQILVIVALAIVAIVAIVGLALDVGLMFIDNARLRRAVDAAALAAALQFRENYQRADLARSAIEILALNSVDDPLVVLEICDSTLPTYNAWLSSHNAEELAGLSPGNHVFHNSNLCTSPPRKMVRVIAHDQVNLAFLPVIGIDHANINANATSETASIDLVLVIDTGESMTYDAPNGDPLRDPSVCNYEDTGDGMPGECHPFEEVKQAAVDFVRAATYFPYDRVSIISFNKIGVTNLSFADIDYSTTDPLEIAAIEATIVSTIEGLMVYEGQGECPNGQPCRVYDEFDEFQSFAYGDPYLFPDDPRDPGTFDEDINNPSQCPSTNIGAGMLLAGNEFATPPIRQNALWAVIMLTDGAANAGACPRSTWGEQPYEADWVTLWCRDPYADTRHCADADTLARCTNAGGAWDPDNYDADDYARDMVDFVAYDQQAYIYTIGLGNIVVNSSVGDPDAGQELLLYAANTGDGDPGNAGLYYYAPDATELQAIFQRIADNIAIRLSQ
ncbi:MAG: Tad domain-containing protein [Chloroflexi bacterium]|nr:Tad domain-containing protein [Chloroflexota bacterium]